MADLPDGIDISSMYCAIAWDMVLKSIAANHEYNNLHRDEKLKTLTEAYGTAYRAVVNAGTDPAKKAAGR